jgi:hypothetical protein
MSSRKNRALDATRLDHVEDQVVLGASDPEDAPQGQRPEVDEVDVSLVEEHNLAGANARAQLPRAFGVVVSGGVDDGEAGQKTVQVQPQMALGRSLASAMLGPIHTRGHQLDRGGIHHADDAAKATRQAPALPSTGKTRVQAAQMLQDRPEQLLRQRGIALTIGVGQVVARGRRGPAQADEQAAVQSQTIANIVEPDGVNQLRVEKGDDMAPWRIGPRPGVDAGLVGELAHQKRWNEIANLAQDAELTSAWSGGCLGSGMLFVHPLLVEPFRPRAKRFLLQPVGWL